MKRYLRDNSLTLFFLGLFVAALIGQTFVGHADFNGEQVAHEAPTVSLGHYVASSAYWVDVMENWQSEYLQFAVFIIAAVWFVQRGSTESKPIDKAGPESDQAQKVGGHAQRNSPKWAKFGDWRTTLYSNSLLALMAAIWVLSWLAQLVTGRIAYNAEQLEHDSPALSVLQYASSSDFWNRTLQNWQSEFLAIASIAVFSIWLRQRGSPQSKPVGEPHTSTGAEG